MSPAITKPKNKSDLDGDERCTPLPAGPFSIIYADPPWTYRDRNLNGSRGAGCKYDLLTEGELAALPISGIAAPDSALFLWVTMPKLPVAFDVMAAWGFSYKTVAFTWVKSNRKGPGHFFGLGHWTRANAELCLLGVRGRPKRVSAGVSSLIVSPVREHSRKPDEARERIVRLMGDARRIELFARDRADGWSAWGWEAPT